MELSFEMPNVVHHHQQQFEELKKRSHDLLCPQTVPTPRSCCNDIALDHNNSDLIDVERLSFADDEIWLYDCFKRSVSDLNQWLYDNKTADEKTTSEANHDEENHHHQEEMRNSTKNIDTRTFTRPKKRFTRPSVEKYNEELYGGGGTNDEDDNNGITTPMIINNNTSMSSSWLKKSTDSGIHSSGQVSQQETPNNETTIVNTAVPLHFDLTQPTSSYYFENILANAPNIDSFQNMSPPSLVNSMCSSTFANLMESSFIKNDPALKEISDMDYTKTVLLNDIEAPTFTSFSESGMDFSSLNSDMAAETFLKNVDSMDETLLVPSKDVDLDLDRTIGSDATYNKYDASSAQLIADFTKLQMRNSNTLTATTTTTPNHRTKDNFNETYQRSHKLKTTFNVSDVRNGTIKLGNYDKRITQNNADSSDDDNNQSAEHYHHLTKPLETTRLLDRKKSFTVVDVNKKLSCAPSNNRNDGTFTKDDDLNELSDDADRTMVAKRHEPPHCLRLMSTPKVRNTRINDEILDDNYISPIVPAEQHYSDSDLSSTDEFFKKPNQQFDILNTTVTTTNSNTAIKKQKSLGYIGPKLNLVKETLIRKREIPCGPYANLKDANLGRSQPNLHKLLSNNVVNNKGLRSNLNTMGRTLKGSYTSLKPISANLPVAPPPVAANTTRTIAEVAPIPRENPLSYQQTSSKPIVRASGLPRPVSSTGIPRPLSRIPGPRNVR